MIDPAPERTAEAAISTGAAPAVAQGPAAQALPPLDSRELYFNRELSWLEFNRRVLELAQDTSQPLLERVKFLAIYAANLDEFFMVRVAGLHDQVDARIETRSPDGRSPSTTIDEIAELVGALARLHTAEWETRLRPALAEHGIRIVKCEELDGRELEAVARLFRETVFPVLTPLAVGPGRPFPYISNLSLSIGVSLRDPDNGQETFARVKVPKEVLPRFLAIEDALVPLEDVIARHLDELFPGLEVLHHDFFRVTRDADFDVSDEADDLLQAIEEELRRRRFGEVVRLEVGAGMDPGMRKRLVDWLEIEERQVYDLDGMLDLGDLWEVHGIEGHRGLRDEPWTPVSRGPFAITDGPSDLFAAIRERDLLVHHPYDSFTTSVERFVEQAVRDPDVLAIKMTVYRTSDDSTLLPHLIEAAERGKQAACMVELTARFDERQNIVWARKLEEAGAHVVHGVAGLKTHAKTVLVVRRERTGVRRYVHIGTGNYHAKTARLYEDFGLFTDDPGITADIADVFNALTGNARPPGYRRALVSPEHTREGIIKEIEHTIEAHERGEHARIRIKINALVDSRSIEALYRASQAGVPVELNVRGICCLRPGIPGVSDNVRVVSVVGRFLEHSRIFSFERGDDRCTWMGSPDLMPRNLDDRVEVLVPVEDPALQDELEDTLERCLADDTFAWELDADGRWHRRDGGTRSAHAELIEQHARSTAETA